MKEGCSQVRWRCTQTRRHLADRTAFSAWRSSTRFGTVATVHNFVPRCNGCFNGRFVESIIVNDDGEEHVVLKYINFVVKLCFVVIGSFSCFLPNSIYMIQDGFNVSFFFETRCYTNLHYDITVFVLEPSLITDPNKKTCLLSSTVELPR